MIDFLRRSLMCQVVPLHCSAGLDVQLRDQMPRCLKGVAQGCELGIFLVWPGFCVLSGCGWRRSRAERRPRPPTPRRSLIGDSERPVRGPRRRGPPGRRLPRPEPQPPRPSKHTAQKTMTGSTAWQSPAVGTRTPRTLLRPHHRRTRPRRPQTLEATDALHPPPRPPARHLPRHRQPRLRPHRSSLNSNPPTDQHASPAITHQLVSRFSDEAGVVQEDGGGLDGA